MLRDYVSTRVLVDYAAFEEDLTKGVVICTNLGVLNLIRMLIRSYGLREANWVTSYTAAGYLGPDETQFDLIDSEVSEFLGETDDMTFCNDLTQALNNLSAAFQAGCCGDGSYGAGENEPAESTNVDDGLDPPPGFDTYAEYRTYKCAIANRIIEGIRQDMIWLGAGTLVTLTATGLIAALLTPIPGDEILLLVGFLVSIFLQGILATTTAAIVAEIDASRQNLVCLLYDAENAGDAKGAVLSFMQSALTSVEAALFAAVWSYASVNALFDKDVILESSPLSGAVSCGLCGSECELCVTFDGDEDVSGVFTIISDTVIDMVSGIEQPAVSFWGICDFNTREGTQDFCGPSVTLSSYSLTGFTPKASVGYRIWDSSLTIVYTSSTPPDWSTLTDVRRVQLLSSTAFTGTITLV